MEKKKKILHRSKDIHIKLRPEEYDMIKNKSSSYPSMTRLIVDAVSAFDERGGVNYVNVLNEWSKDFAESRADMGRVGNNINQIAHVCNIIKNQSGEIDPSSLSVFSSELDELKKLLIEIRDNQVAFVSKVTKK